MCHFSPILMKWGSKWHACIFSRWFNLLTLIGTVFICSDTTALDTQEHDGSCQHGWVGVSQWTLCSTQGGGGIQSYLTPITVIINQRVTNHRGVLKGCDYDLHNLTVTLVVSMIMWLVKSRYRGGYKCLNKLPPKSMLSLVIPVHWNKQAHELLCIGLDTATWIWGSFLLERNALSWNNPVGQWSEAVNWL